MNIDRILVRGQEQLLQDASNETLEYQRSYLVGAAAMRDKVAAHEIELTPDSVLELQFEDDVVWYASRSGLDDLFPGLQLSRDGGPPELPLFLEDPDPDRAGGGVFLRAITFFSRKKILPEAIGPLVERLAKDLEEKVLETRPGLFRVEENFKLLPTQPGPSTDPYLLFIHGTASATQKTFAGLNGTGTWKDIHNAYPGRVLALQHRSLTESPLKNVRDLVTGLPAGCILHVVTSSRGGLVGELLARFCNATNNVSGFSADEIAALSDAGRSVDVDNIIAIQQLTAARQIKVERFVRVACPGAGTTLASRRLDVVLNMIMSLVGLGTGQSANPIFIAFKALIGAVVDCKNDTDILPGLEAMSRQSPMVKVMNLPESPVKLDNSLAIIAGNCKMKLGKKALLVLASKLFFLHRNDLIVDTKSMYARAWRNGKVQFFFHEGTDIDHFKYFHNPLTIAALDGALKTPIGQLIPGFTELTGNAMPDAQYRGIFGIEQGEEFRDEADGDRPILVIMPGIMGSNLKQASKLLWIKYLRFLKGDLKFMSIDTPEIAASSLVATSYRKIANHFSSDYDIVTWPYDWRHDLVIAARLFEAKVKKLLDFNQPIKIVAHSMGGVMFRDFILECPDTWKKLNASRDFRLVWLGAPLGGSFRIPAVLFGEDSVINKLSRIDLVHSKKQLLNIFSRLPGLLSLLPHERLNDMANLNTWESMRAAFGDAGWPLPVADDLKAFGDYRDKILDNEGTIDYSHMSYIAGHDEATPCGYTIEETSQGPSLSFLSTAEGDASVTWDTGIPKRMIDANSVYYCEVTHGALANEPALFPGITDLLTLGTTNLLSRTRPAVRSDQRLFRSPAIDDFDLSEEGVERTLLGMGEGAEASDEQTPLLGSVAMGDLKFANWPVLAGHFKHDGILYAEASIDRYAGGELRRRHHSGKYAGDIGSFEIVEGNRNFHGAIIVGLGDPGSLTAYQLMQTVEEGLVRHLLNVGGKSWPQHAARTTGISSLTVGSGYGGISIENSVRAIVLGICKANERVRKTDGDIAVTIDRIEFIEQYQDRALSCFRAVHKLEAERSGDARIMLGQRTILTRPGYRERLPVDATQGWWTRITVSCLNEKDGKSGQDPTAIREFKYSISTGGAREEVQQMQLRPGTINELIRDIGLNNRWNTEQATSLFNLLTPRDFRERLKRQNNINWILDTETAALPWELLQDAVAGKPLCINAGMVRQLASENYRRDVDPARQSNVLIIADPRLSGNLPQLPGARREGELVRKLLTDAGFDCKDTLTGASHMQILTKLTSVSYKIIHIAGHGVFDPSRTGGSGLVTDGEVISSAEIARLDRTPELVIVNCCHLGRVESCEEKYYQDRYRIAANIGMQLINDGVKAVIAAGWAIHDEAALEFTRVFYNGMLAGYAFGESIADARRTVFERYGAYNTWGAYQCYGDPFYRLDPTRADGAKKGYSFVIPQEAELALGNLRNDIEICAQSTAESKTKLEEISAAIDRDVVRSAEVTEIEALAWFDLDDNEKAIERFKSLVQDESGAFAQSSVEDYHQVRSIQCVRDALANKIDRKAAFKILSDLMSEVDTAMNMGETAERCLLLGHLNQRKALLSASNQKINAYEASAIYYQHATTFENSHYSAFALTYWLEVESVLSALGHHTWGAKVKTPWGSYVLPSSVGNALDLLDEYRAIVEDTTIVDIDYWNLLAPVSIDLGRYMLAPAQVEGGAPGLDDYKAVWDKVGSPAQKKSEIEHLLVLEDLARMMGRKGMRLAGELGELRNALQEYLSGG